MGPIAAIPSVVLLALIAPQDAVVHLGKSTAMDSAALLNAARSPVVPQTQPAATTNVAHPDTSGVTGTSVVWMERSVVGSYVVLQVSCAHSARASLM